MTLTFPFCSLPILLNFLRILLWDSHKYFARHFRSLEIWDSSLCLLQIILISFLHFAMWQFDRSVRFFVYSPRRKWDTLAMKMITQAYPLPPPPLPFLPLYKHVCTAFCGFDFHCESENGKCKRMLHFSLHSPAIRFYHPQWTFSICGPVRLCFRLLKWFHILFLSLSLYRSLSLSRSLSCSGFMQFLRISCALLNILTGVSGSQQGICLLSTASKDFLSGHWAVV